MKPLMEFLVPAGGWFTADRVSLVVASFALLASIWGALISRRNVKAALRSAAAAEEQAGAAIRQSQLAADQLSTVRKIAEVDALADARARIDEAAPSVVVVLSPMDDVPRILRHGEQIPVPHPSAEEPGNRTLNYIDSLDAIVYFVYRGMLINDGDRAARIHSRVTFYAGQHPATGVDISRPMWSAVGHCHVLEAGQAALFELRATSRVGAILKRKESASGGELPFSRDQITFRPGNLDEPCLIVTVETHAEPFLRRKSSNTDAPLVVRDEGQLEVLIRREPSYPQSFEYRHAELLGDEDKLYHLRLMDELQRTLDRRRRQGDTT